MSGTSDYGSTLTFDAQAVGKCMVIDFPELATAKIQTTNHAGNGWGEGIPSGLIEPGDITISLLAETGKLDGIVDKMLAKTVGAVVVANEVDTLSGQGFYLSVKPEAADATSPDAVRLTTVISFTGEITVNTTS